MEAVELLAAARHPAHPVRLPAVHRHPAARLQAAHLQVAHPVLPAGILRSYSAMTSIRLTPAAGN